MTRNPMLRKLRAVLVVLLLGATGWFGWHGLRRPATPAAATGPGALWVADDVVTLRGDAAPVAHNAIWDGHTIKLFALRNEVVAWQVALKPGEPVVAVQVKLEPLRSDAGAQLPARSLKVFREHYLNVTVPSQLSLKEPVPHGQGAGWYPNQLIPLADGETTDAPAGRVSALWFDCHVPPDAKPGVYRGQLTVVAGALQAAWDLELEVLKPTMPRETHFRNWFYYGPEQLREYYKLTDEGSLAGIERKYLQLAHDHRCTLATEVGVDNGNFRWGRFWARYGAYLDGTAFDSGPCRGVGANTWPVALNGEVSDADYAAAAKSVVAFFQAHKMLDRILFFACDEPGDAKAYTEIRRTGKRVHAAVGRQLPVMVTASPQPKDPSWGTLLGAVDIFCSPATTDADMQQVRAEGGQIWVYNGGLAGGPYLDVPVSGVAAWGPCAWRFNLGGWFMWDATYWRQKHFDLKAGTDLYTDPLTFDECKRVRDGKPYPPQWAIRLNGDGVFLYPGEPAGVKGPVASLRLKAFRRGAQDYEYLWLLKQQGHGQEAAAFAAKLSTGRGAWEEKPDAWHEVRRQMADRLAGGKG